MTKATIILRSCGERTTDECRRLLSDVDLNLIIRQTPFSRCLKRAMEIGHISGATYTIMIDADTLPLPWAIDALLEAARADTGDWFEKHGLVRCKFFGRRGAGNRIYRTALLPRALELIEQYQDEPRPETAIIKHMEREGHSRQEIKRVVALHGYEQSYRDIYRTLYVHGVKSRDRIKRYLAKWAKAARKDYDFTVAARAARAGVRHEGPITIDADMEWNWGAAPDKGPLSAWAASTKRAWKRCLREENDGD